MESIDLFFQEVTRELLYNIVYDYKEIDYRDLSKIFKKKTGYRPMDFFGIADQTDRGLLDFIKRIPGVTGRKKISIVRYLYFESSDEDIDDEDSEHEHVYKVFNETDLCLLRPLTVAEYREMILIKCCKLDNFDDLSHCKDANGNTPFHYIAALPGINYDCNTLVKYLLQAGVDPLTTNNNGQTFLHIIFGRFRAKNDDDDELYFMNTRVRETEWFVEDRVGLLKLLSQYLSPAYTALLANTQDKDGNTVLHEYLSSTAMEDFTGEDNICKELLNFGASLRIQNNSGEFPLHYAYTPKIFKIFLQNGAVCRARNDRDESPVLFILKKAVDLALPQTFAASELVDQAFVKTTLTQSVSRAISLLDYLESIVSQNKDAKKTVWITDVKGNVAINVLLIAIRIGSYDLPIWNRPELCSAMVELLNEMLRDASPSEMKWANKKGQSFLHVFLEMGDDNEHTIRKEEYICQSIEILLKHGADINAVDLQGHTPLDITYKYRNKQSSLYQKCAELLITYGGTGKLRSCPKPHLGNAEHLTNPRIQPTSLL